jgi:ParB family transcriptional regulator, chromosome partitioning protein
MRCARKIDENLCRADLTELERGEHLAKRKEIYEWWRPETKAGAARAAGMNRKLGHHVDENSAPTFTEDTAAKVGMSQRAVQQSLRRVNKIDPAVRDRIRDNPEIGSLPAEALASQRD